MALQILIIALGSPGCIYLTAPERWLYQHFEIFKHCMVEEEGLKYTEVQSQSQQMAFTRSPSLSNNPKILNNYLIFKAPTDATIDEHFCVYSLLPTTIGAVQYV